MANTRISVLHLTTISAIGGAERMVHEMIRAHDRDRFSMAVASLYGPGTLTEMCREAGVEAWNNVGAGGKLARMIRLWRWTGEIRGRFDVIQTYGLKADLVARLFKKRMGARTVICSIRSVDDGRPTLKARLDRWTAGKADLFIANSEACRRSRLEREKLAPEKVITILNGVELDTANRSSSAGERARLGVRADAWPVIAHIANVRPAKAHETVLRAAPQVLKRHPAALFFFAGRPDDGGAFQRAIAAQGLEDSLRMVGFVEDGRMLARAADIVILPSFYEGCPVSLLEAMAEGRAIVATKVGGIPEMLENEKEALLIAPGDAEALAAAIHRLARDKAFAAALGRAARARAERDFPLENMIRKYQDVYARLGGG